MKITLHNKIYRGLSKLYELFGNNLLMSVAAVSLTVLAIGLAVFLFINSAAPSIIYISSGPEGGVFNTLAGQYKKLLAKQGVRLIVLPSEGSLDNLKKLADPNLKVDIGIVQGGEAEGIDISRLVSLGSIAYQPLMIFYRGEPKRLL